MSTPTLTPSPVDFAGIRASFARAIQHVTGLPSARVVEMQATQEGAQRPSAPFAAFMLTGLGLQLGWDACMPNEIEGFAYVGPRQMTAQFQFFGRSKDEAFGLASLWACSLWLPPAQSILAEVADVQTWRVEAVQPLTALLAAGYEGRAAVNATFGVPSILQAAIPAVESVQITGP